MKISGRRRCQPEGSLPSWGLCPARQDKCRKRPQWCRFCSTDKPPDGPVLETSTGKYALTKAARSRVSIPSGPPWVSASSDLSHLSTREQYCSANHGLTIYTWSANHQKKEMKQSELMLTAVLVVLVTLAGITVSRGPGGPFVSRRVFPAGALRKVAQTSASSTTSLIPFTLVSVTFAVNFVAPPVSVRHANLEAVSENNRHIRLDQSFEHLDDLQPKSVQTSVDEPDGVRTSTYWSADRELLKKGILSVHTGSGHPQFPLSENNCAASAGQQGVHPETLTIGGQQFQTSVIGNVSQSAATTEWRALLPGLGCLILKRVYSHTDKGGGKTITEPLSLVLGEPDPALFSKFDAEVATSEDVGTLQAFDFALSEQGKEESAAARNNGRR
jgi:hypothetical protein